MSLTGKTIGDLTYLSGATSSTLFPAELNGVTYRVPFSGMTGVSGSSGTSGTSGSSGSSGTSGTSGSSGTSGTSGSSGTSGVTGNSGSSGTSGSSGVSPTVNYTIYKVLLSYGGTFFVNQLQNTIGDGSDTDPNDIEWSNPDNGVLLASKTNSFSSLNIFIPPTSFGSGTSTYFVTGTKVTNSIIQFLITRYDGDNSSTPYFNDIPIEIIIYS